MLFELHAALTSKLFVNSKTTSLKQLHSICIAKTTRENDSCAKEDTLPGYVGKGWHAFLTAPYGKLQRNYHKQLQSSTENCNVLSLLTYGFRKVCHSLCKC